MKTAKPFLILLIFLLGFGSGFWLHVRTSASAKKQTEQLTGQVAPGLSSREITNATPLATQLQSQLDLTNGQEYWLQWIAGIEGAALADFPKLAQIAAANPAALRILALRWLELDPAHLFETLRANTSLMLDSPDRIDDQASRELYLLLFQEWPKTDLEAAATALSGDAKIPDYRRMQWEFLNGLAEIDPLRALEMMKESGKLIQGVDSRKIAEWIEQDPRTAVDAIIANNVGHASLRLLDAAARIWAKSDPLAAMELASSTEGKLGRTFREGAFAQWLEKDLESAANWLADQESLQLQDELRPAVIKQWAKKDPEGAMEWTIANLEGTRQALAMEELIATVAAKDRDLAVKFFDELAPGVARNKTARIIAKEIFSSFPAGETDAGEDDPAITWIKNLDQGARDAALMQITDVWAAADPASLKTYLLSDLGTALADHQLELAAVYLAQKSPPAMMEWTKEIPPRKQEIFVKSAMESWLRDQPQAAKKWFVDLPKTDERRPVIIATYLDDFKYLNEDIAAERLRLLPKEDWQALDQLGLNAEKIEKIKELAER
ncbi:hypothetical protein V2O64_24885 (plasmid) [Verrucomicrobiaceae bacterium 227]